MICKAQYSWSISGVRRWRFCVELALGVMLVGPIISAHQTQAQTFSVIYSFTGGSDGANPNGGLIRDSVGNLYGTTATGGTGRGVVFVLDPANKETPLYTFTGASDGANPYGGPIRDAAGNLYGTTEYGGAYGRGTVFKVDQFGNETALYSFRGNGQDGLAPVAGLIRDRKGNLYGTTSLGGTSNDGVVFILSKTGKEGVLYSFANSPNDGAYPAAALIRDAMGNLYGTTPYGGALGCTFGTTCGVVFKVDTAGNETVLHSFTGGTDGGQPYAGLLRDGVGNLYGTTSVGGTGACAYGCGTVFKLDTSGNLTILYSFTGGPDGGNPQSGLIRDASGNLFGTAANGGIAGCLGYGLCGTVFKLDMSGIFTVLHSFTGGIDGGSPDGNLTLDGAGNLYGTTAYGGIAGCIGGAGCGVVFKVSPR